MYVFLACPGQALPGSSQSSARADHSWTANVWVQLSLCARLPALYFASVFVEAELGLSEMKKEKPQLCLWLLWVGSTTNRDEHSKTRFPKLSLKILLVIREGKYCSMFLL